MAFTLRYMGKRAYKYVTETMKIPLPSLAKLHRWASKLDFQPGTLHCIFKVMKAVCHTFDESEKIAIITFDEVKVKEVHEYDQKHDCVMGPYSQMQVAMIRGLFAKWKVPIYLDFDKQMTSDLLNSLIRDAHDSGYVVKGCCSDMGGGNQGLLRVLGISPERTWIEHPVLKDEKIYFFGDAPHCLKLVRNWLLDTGFLLPDGRVVRKDPLEKLLNHVEVSSCFKLTERHLKCEKTERQSVRLAAELISHTTSTALRRYFPDDSDALNLAAVIEIINGWFDVFNSYTLYDVPLKSAYGTHLDAQEKCLDDMSYLMSSMKCVGKTCLQVFQKAILMSISSLRLLRMEMKTKFNKPFILTHRLNQDVLENFFCQIRTRGGLHDHPTPLEAIWRVRMIILGKNPGIVQANANALDRSKDDGGEFLTVVALQTIKEEMSGNTTPSTPLPDEDLLSEDVDDPSILEPNAPRNTLEEKMENDGVTYLAGWVAYKHKNVTWLGKPTREGTNSLGAHLLPSWVQQLSFGGLMEPSAEWLSAALEMEKIFKEFHKDNIFKGPQTVQKCIFKVRCQITLVPEDVIKTYILQRTRIRIKFLNASAVFRKQEEKAKKEEIKAKKVEEKAKKEAEQKRNREEQAAIKELKQRQKQEIKMEKENKKRQKQEERKRILEEAKIVREEMKKRKLEEAKQRQEETRAKREAAKKRKQEECKASSEVVASDRKRARKMMKLTT
ncbi:Transposable element P transposase [Frankliniella fusca]|uniref:Transposable element P transposase n=1 Tax=Frankliniella fusca TaxID=407009 RepID=A0AAE1LNG1_9NEOP|nr:Transposable element P transposase [Frankliniella fusca]